MTVDDPMTPYQQIAKDQDLIHTVLRRALESIQESQPAEYFADYCHATFRSILNNLNQKEEIIFPRVQSAFGSQITQLQQEHVEIRKALNQALSETSAVELKSSASRIQQLILPNFKKEQLDFTSDKLQQAFPDPNLILQLHDDLMVVGRRQSNPPQIFVAFILKHLSPQDADYFFRSVPWVIRRTVLPTFCWKYDKTWWVYAKQTGGQLE